MKTGLSFKLACGNLCKNYRFFIPRILSETGLLACFYIIFTLSCDGRLAKVKGGSYIPTFMCMGAVVVGLLSAILMLYTNSFLMKQRKREFGVYSVLGMGKKHICNVLFHESFICSFISVVLGLIVGILFYKFSSLAICNLLKAEIVAGFYFITPMTILPAGAIFIGIDVLTYIINCISIGRMKTTDLLSSTNTGEKEPKVKWVLLVLGILSLGGGYYITITIKNPLESITLFFLAMFLIIAGTYFLFVAGSIFLLKILKKNENYYYKPSHITAVSGLLYRMKQNAVGLASVAVFATGILIMISSTFCLYSRTEGVLEANYPQDYYAPTVFYVDGGKTVNIPEEFMKNTVSDCADKYGLKIKESFMQEFFDVTFARVSGKLTTTNTEYVTNPDLSSMCNITFITENMYTSLGGKPIGLDKNEVAVCAYNIKFGFDDDSFNLFDKQYNVSKRLDFFPIDSHMFQVNCYGMVVADDNVFTEIFNKQKEAYGVNSSMLQRRYCVKFENRDKAFEVGNDFSKDIEETIDNYILSEGYTSYTIGGYKSIWETRKSLYGMYGTLLFLGVLLGLVCLFATILIIYYKQISEGYEDRERYQIMHKIGMTDHEIQKTIRTQIMMVFFLPLIVAGIHIIFTYPIISRIMEILLLNDVWSFAKWCIIVYIVFSIVYALIYKLTAKIYYKIVN